MSLFGWLDTVTWAAHSRTFYKCEIGLLWDMFLGDDLFGKNDQLDDDDFFGKPGGLFSTGKGLFDDDADADEEVCCVVVLCTLCCSVVSPVLETML